MTSPTPLSQVPVLQFPSCYLVSKKFCTIGCALQSLLTFFPPFLNAFRPTEQITCHPRNVVSIYFGQVLLQISQAASACPAVFIFLCLQSSPCPLEASLSPGMLRCSLGMKNCLFTHPAALVMLSFALNTANTK